MLHRLSFDPLLLLLLLFFFLIFAISPVAVIAEDAVPQNSRVYIVDPNDPTTDSFNAPLPSYGGGATYYDLDALDREIAERKAQAARQIDPDDAPPQEKIKTPTKKGPGISFSDMAKSIQKSSK